MLVLCGLFAFASAVSWHPVAAAAAYSGAISSPFLRSDAISYFEFPAAASNSAASAASHPGLLPQFTPGLLLLLNLLYRLLLRTLEL